MKLKCFRVGCLVVHEDTNGVWLEGTLFLCSQACADLVCGAVPEAGRDMQQVAENSLGTFQCSYGNKQLGDAGGKEREPTD